MFAISGNYGIRHSAALFLVEVAQMGTLVLPDSFRLKFKLHIV